MRLEQLSGLNRIDEANIRLIRTIRMNQLIAQYENKKKKKIVIKKKEVKRKPKEIDIKNLSNDEKLLLMQRMKDIMEKKWCIWTY